MWGVEVPPCCEAVKGEERAWLKQAAKGTGGSGGKGGGAGAANVAPHNGGGGGSAKLPPLWHHGPPGAEALGQQNGMGISCTKTDGAGGSRPRDGRDSIQWGHRQKGLWGPCRGSGEAEQASREREGRESGGNT